mmetsp:Transcript_28970/g.44729  ORF Transcript_28970/g.44729 Transcript_28970/m.44729 type:complete len:258 (-) Transcript_28970:107-880(-)
MPLPSSRPPPWLSSESSDTWRPPVVCVRSPLFSRSIFPRSTKGGATRTGSPPRGRPTPSTRKSTRTAVPTSRRNSPVSRSFVRSSVSSHIRRCANSTFASRRHTLWRSRSTEATLPPRWTSPRACSRRSSPLTPSSPRTRILMLSVSRRVAVTRVSLPGGVSLVYPVRPTVVSVRLPVLVRGIQPVFLPRCPVPVRTDTTTVASSTRRCTVSGRLVITLRARQRRTLLQSPSPPWVDSRITERSTKTGSCLRVLLSV